MDETDPCLSKERTSVLSDPAAIARQKRMEIRRFKAMSRSTPLVHNDPPPHQGGFLKRARPLLSINAFSDFCDDLEEDSTLISSLKTEEGNNLLLSSQLPTLTKGKEVSGLDHISTSGSSFLRDSGLVRSKSLPPDGWWTSKCYFHMGKTSRGCPDAGVEGHFVTVGSNEQLGCSLPNFLKDCRVGFSSLATAEISRSSPQGGFKSVAEVAEQLEKNTPQAEVQNSFTAAEQSLEPSQGGTETVTDHAKCLAGSDSCKLNTQMAELVGKDESIYKFPQQQHGVKRLSSTLLAPVRKSGTWLGVENGKEWSMF